MSVDSNLFEKLMIFSNQNSSKFTLSLNDTDYDLVDVSIEHSSVPVNEPTTRGGVYFSEKYAYKMKGAIRDLSVCLLYTSPSPRD